MCDELKAELSEGDKRARALVEHVVYGMGASECALLVIVDDETFEVIVQHKPVSPL